MESTNLLRESQHELEYRENKMYSIFSMFSSSPFLGITFLNLIVLFCAGARIHLNTSSFKILIYSFSYILYMFQRPLYSLLYGGKSFIQPFGLEISKPLPLTNS